MLHHTKGILGHSGGKDLTSRSFLDAFTSFTGRRDRCTDPYNDNSTTILTSEQSQQTMPDLGMIWLDQGGLWEATVK